MADTIPSKEETHLLYVLLDSNLPTGGFVASSGLESYVKHGFFTTTPTYDTLISPESNGTARNLKTTPTKAMMDFAQAEVENYASTTLSFVNDTWRTVNEAINGSQAATQADANSSDKDRPEWYAVVADKIKGFDEYHESTMLSHVARRSSKAQGVAMLTLYSRGLSIPTGFNVEEDDHPIDRNEVNTDESNVRRNGDKVVEVYKRLVRAGKSPGHLAVCWGVITAALGLSLDRALHLHLFLHARSLLSSAVRLNIIGPYASSQLLLHPMRALIDIIVDRYSSSHTHISTLSHEEGVMQEADHDGFWDWAEVDDGPATTWPLGEILTGRHDLQHSRIFNS